MGPEWKELGQIFISNPVSTVKLPEEVAPGTRGTLRLSDSNRQGPDPWATSAEPREFDVQAILSKQPTTALHFVPFFEPAAGASNMLLPKDILPVPTPYGNVLLIANTQHELSAVCMTILSEDFGKVRVVFQKAAIEMLNYFSTQLNIPLYVDAIRTIEKHSMATEFYTTVGFPNVGLTVDSPSVFPEMRWIYAQYREGKNTRSAFYRFLCFYKIMEFLLASPQRHLRDRCKELECNISDLDYTMPDSVTLSPEYRKFVGKGIKYVFDSLELERKAVAHFMLEDNRILDLADLNAEIHLGKAAYVAESCCRVLIRNHEIMLKLTYDKVAALKQVTRPNEP